MENNVKAWPFSSSQYKQEATNNVHKHLTERNKKFPSPKLQDRAAIKNDYRPEVDQIDKLSPTDAVLLTILPVINWCYLLDCWNR